MRHVARSYAGVELVVASAMLCTFVAIYFREPLTSQTLVFAPDRATAAFSTYEFDDQSNGGNSIVSADSGTPLSWRCTLQLGSQWPYCGFGIQFDNHGSGHGLDLSDFERIDLRVRYRGTGDIIRVSLKDHDPRYQSLATAQDKVNQANFPIRTGEQTIPLKLADFGVAEWWRNVTKAPPALARPSFENIVALEFITGPDSEPGNQWLQVEQISFQRHWITSEGWFIAIALFWLVLIVSILTYRRRQIARMQRSAQQALRESERLYHGILQASTDTIVLLGPDGHVNFVNDPGLDAMEVEDSSRVLGKHWTRLWRDESATVVAAALAKAMNGGTARFRAFCATSKGTPKWWDVLVSPMLDQSGGVKGVLTISRDVTSEREKSEQLKWASEHDALTQLPNRRAFQAHLQAATLRAMNGNGEVGLLLVDLDHFKHVNDSYGHSAGDELLQSVAERMRRAIAPHHFVARIGGDEFAVILEHKVSEDALLTLGQAVLRSIEAPSRVEGRMLGTGGSIGGALFPTTAASANDLFKKADTALYALKQQGRGGTRLFDDYMLEDAEKSASQLSLARGSISENTVVPIYQPKIDVESRRIVGLEALLRWRHPSLGLQLPATVEEAFNDYELAAKIGALMQRKVARDVRSWLSDGIEFGRVSVNAAPAEFLRDNYAEQLLEVLEKHGVPPERIEVEITEHAFLGRGPEYVARALALLKLSGIAISLDDFGTGHSSLSHLRDFPVDVVKIDMSFVQQMTANPEIAAIVAAVIRLARSLSIDVVAEGVETPAQLDLLRAMGCQMAQGHLFAAGVEARGVPELASATKVKRAAA